MPLLSAKPLFICSLSILLSASINSLEVGDLKTADLPDVSTSLLEQGYFASLNPQPVFGEELLAQLGAILDEADVNYESERLDDAHYHGNTIGWTFRAQKKAEGFTATLCKYAHMPAPKPVIDIIEAFFRFIPEGDYGITFVLIDDFSRWSKRTRTAFMINPHQPAVSFEAASLIWHQDKFAIDRLFYRYLGFGIIASQGCSPHELEIGLAAQKNIKKRAKKSGALKCSDRNAKILKKLSSVPGAMYLIDQNKNINGKYIVHRHSGYQAEISASDCNPKRQKFILRILEIPKNQKFSSQFVADRK